MLFILFLFTCIALLATLRTKREITFPNAFLHTPRPSLGRGPPLIECERTRNKSTTLSVASERRRCTNAPPNTSNRQWQRQYLFFFFSRYVLREFPALQFSPKPGKISVIVTGKTKVIFFYKMVKCVLFELIKSEDFLNPNQDIRISFSRRVAMGM